MRRLFIAIAPYFEVEVDKPPTQARTTIFTIVNTSQYPQIARVTLWSDLAYPVVNFNRCRASATCCPRHCSPTCARS